MNRRHHLNADGEGLLDLAEILDVCSQRVVGWSMAEHLRTTLVMGALDMAVWNGDRVMRVINHSDHGCQYPSLRLGERYQAVVFTASCARRGCYDYALAEGSFATLECELLVRQTLRTAVEARTALFEYIEVLNNRTRRHPAPSYL